MLVDDAIKFAEEMDKTGSTGKFVNALNTLAGEVKRLRSLAAGAPAEPEMKWQVDIIESERGWGSKVEDLKQFATRLEAEQFRDAYNAENNALRVPDWYMYAGDPYPIVPKV